jgi:diphthamide synthase (EF-2-diphthine--ammonia ligase)
MSKRLRGLTAVTAGVVGGVLLARYQQRVRSFLCGVSIAVAERQYLWFQDQDELPESMDFESFVHALKCHADDLAARNGGER